MIRVNGFAISKTEKPMQLTQCCVEANESEILPTATMTSPLISISSIPKFSPPLYKAYLCIFWKQHFTKRSPKNKYIYLYIYIYLLVKPSNQNHPEIHTWHLSRGLSVEVFLKGHCRGGHLSCSSPLCWHGPFHNASAIPQSHASKQGQEHLDHHEVLGGNQQLEGISRLSVTASLMAIIPPPSEDTFELGWTRSGHTVLSRHIVWKNFSVWLEQTLSLITW